MTDVNNPIFHDKAKASAQIIASRWLDRTFHPHCGSDNVHRVAGRALAGYFICRDGRDRFTGENRNRIRAAAYPAS